MVTVYKLNQWASSPLSVQRPTTRASVALVLDLHIDGHPLLSGFLPISKKKNGNFPKRHSCCLHCICTLDSKCKYRGKSPALRKPLRNTVGEQFDLVLAMLFYKCAGGDNPISNGSGRSVIQRYVFRMFTPHSTNTGLEKKCVDIGCLS